MNFLAHALLAGEQPADQLGGLLGDFVKGYLPAGLPSEIAEGVRLHRQIDVFADTHPVFIRSRSRVSSERRRVSGIMVDMFYDHFLARHWSAFCQKPLENYAAEMYALLTAHLPLLPLKLTRILPYMRDEDWLTSYRSLNSVVMALDAMAGRMRRDGGLEGAGEELDSHYGEFETDFFEFIGDALQFTDHYRADRLLRNASKNEITRYDDGRLL